jgi:phage/plasmid-associated DNA primase
LRAPNRHKTIAELKGVRVAWTNEVSKKQADKEFIKEISDGTALSYQVMYGTTETLNVEFKVFMVSNNTIEITADNGIDRRFVLCQFDSSFRAGENGIEAVDDYENRVFIPDPDFSNKMKTEYRDPFVHVLMDACYNYVHNGMPPVPADWEREQKEMIADNSSFKDFFETNFVVEKELSVHRYVLEGILTNYKQEKIGMKGLKDELKRMGIPYVYDKEKMVKGVKGLFKGFGVREIEV